MARMTVVGSASHQRKDNRIEVPVAVSFGGNRYQTLDWSLGGFRVGGYQGDLLPGHEFKLDGIGFTVEEIYSVIIDCKVVRSFEGQLAVSFVELTPKAYDALEALMMRRKKYFEKLIKL
ncbi:MAG: hypothetical protein HYW28_14190 [Rhodospirillales bacterium]|nr:hypothetical protein [Rhodospirillales bacterium]